MNIHRTALLHRDVTLVGECEIGPYCVIGSDHGPLELEDATVRSHTVVEGGSEIAPGLETGHHAVIRTDNRIGRNLRIGSYSSLEGRAEIGDYVRIHGRCEATSVVLRDFSRVYGGTYLTDNRLPPSILNHPPVVDEGAVLCMGVILIAGVTVGLGSFVGASTVVSKDVPPATVLLRDGRTLPIEDLSYGGVQHPWTRHYRQDYPKEAWPQIDALHERIVG